MCTKEIPVIELRSVFKGRGQEYTKSPCRRKEKLVRQKCQTIPGWPLVGAVANTAWVLSRVLLGAKGTLWSALEIVQPPV